MTRRVVITGTGVVTPLGHSVDEMWRRLLNCESGIGKTTLFDASTFPTQFSAEVRNYDCLAGLTPEAAADQAGAGRNSGFMLGAARQAWKEAGLPDVLSDTAGVGSNAVAPDRIARVLGCRRRPARF